MKSNNFSLEAFLKDPINSSINLAIFLAIIDFVVVPFGLGFFGQTELHGRRDMFIARISNGLGAATNTVGQMAIKIGESEAVRTNTRDKRASELDL